MIALHDTGPIEEREVERPARILPGLATGIIVLAAWLVLQAWGLGWAPFHSKGEPREAIVVADILQRGEWILPMRNAVELPAKPPLYHWLAAGTSRAMGGLSELTARLPSAVQSLGAALLLLAAATALYGARCGLMASLILLSNFEWLRAATSARVDMTLAFGLTCAFVGLLMLRDREHCGWRLLVDVGLVWAVLAKGPVGLALPALQVLLVCILDRSTALLRRIRPLRALILVTVVAGTWYGLATARGGYDFFAKQILDENVYRFLGSRGLTGGHRHSVVYLASMLLVGFLPWTLFLPSVLGGLWRRPRKKRIPDPQTFALVWCILVFAFYAIPASKRGVYLLPLYPALSLLLACWFGSLWRNETSPRLLRPVLMLAGAVLLVLCTAGALVAAGHSLSIPVLPAIGDLLPRGGGSDFERVGVLLSTHSYSLALAFTAAAAAALGVFLAARSRSWRLVFTATFLAFAILATSARLLILSEFAEQRTRRNFVARVRSILSNPNELSAYRQFDYGMVYYWGGPIPMEHIPLSASGPRYLVMSESQWTRLPDQDRRFYERLPELDSDRGGNLGRLIVAERIVSPSATQHGR